MTPIDQQRPRLRLIDTSRITYEGMEYVHLRDPYDLAGRNLMVPQPLVPVLALCDGGHDLVGIQAALSLRYKLRITLDRVRELVSTLDEACLLENEHYAQVRAQVLADYRSAPFRPPALAGKSYPETSADLSAHFQDFIDRAGVSLDGVEQPFYRGVLSPHIDYERGGLVYAQTWTALSRAAQSADLAVIFGTDHYSEGFPLTLTRQNYAIPLGILNTPARLVDKLASILGEEAAFAGEIHHRSEHSIELAAAWLQFFRGSRPIEMLPILAGQIEALSGPDGSLRSNQTLEKFIGAIQSESRRRQVLVVAAGDLAHIGPAFGGEPVGPSGLDRIHSDDQRLTDWIVKGDAEGFYSEIQTTCLENNVCGTAPIYLTMRILGPLTARLLGYAACPADQQDTSFVTIAGMGMV